MGVESGRKGSLLADLERLEQRIRELEREKAQAAADNARLHAAFDTAPFPVILAQPLRDPSGRIADFALADANVLMGSWLHRSPAEVRGTRLSAALPPGACPPMERLMELFQAGAREEIEVRLSAPGGSTWYLRTIIALPDGLLVFWRDISTQKRVEAELKDREDRFRRVIQFLPLMVVALDERRNIVVWNQQCERATGWSAEEVVMNPNAMTMFFPEPEARERMLHEWKVRGKNYEGWEWTIRSKDGRDITIAWFSNHGRYPIPGWGSWACGVDVTARHLAQQQEKGELEARLQQAQKMESIGLLAGGIAHDFNNLLSPIMGFAELALGDTDNLQNPANVEGLRQILKAAERGMDLTRRLLAFSRKQVLDTRPMNLNDEVSATAHLLRRVIGEDVTVTLQLDGDIGKIRADPTQIQQVLMNLALNARDAMPDGGKLILETANVMLMEHLVRAFPGVKPGPYVMLTVSDTGQGMDEQVQQRIFEPFFTTKGPGKGTGLGLAIVMGVVHQHEGHLEVDSQRGLGTTFKLYFPRLPDEAPAQEQGAKANERAVGRETVLVAEDEPSVRQMACRVLETHGYTVLEAPDGPTAEQLFHRSGDSVQLLLTDVMMPQMNGMELYRRLSSMRSGLKVLFMTGYAHDLLERYGKEGMEVPVLNKPFTIAHLTQKVREVLDA